VKNTARIIYLHGFASGPGSRKAQVFQARFEQAGLPVSVPRLDEGNFFGLTISSQYAVIEREARGEPVVLVGSSMGGYLASLYASRHPEVTRLVLLAPAFHFHARWPELIGPGQFAAWRETGALEVFHYADKAPRQVGWQLAEDAARWDPAPSFAQPALIFHGVNDPVVPVARSEAFAAAHPNVTLHTFDAGHELTEVLDEMWDLTADFLGIASK
jgi:pimeloyl-ACP methyl ester carboxylesterase